MFPLKSLKAFMLLSVALLAVGFSKSFLSDFAAERDPGVDIDEAVDVRTAVDWFNEHLLDPETELIKENSDYNFYYKILAKGGANSAPTYRVLLMRDFINPDTADKFTATKINMWCGNGGGAIISDSFSLRLSRPQTDYQDTSYENAQMDYSDDFRVMHVTFDRDRWVGMPTHLIDLQIRLCGYQSLRLP